MASANAESPSLPSILSSQTPSSSFFPACRQQNTMSESNSDYLRLHSYSRTLGISRKSRPPPLDLSKCYQYYKADSCVRLLPTEEGPGKGEEEYPNMTHRTQYANPELLGHICRSPKPASARSDSDEDSDEDSGKYFGADPGEDSSGLGHQGVPPPLFPSFLGPVDFNPEARGPRQGDDWEFTATRMPGHLVGDFAPENDRYRRLDHPQNVAWYRPDLGGFKSIVPIPTSREESEKARKSHRTRKAEQGRAEMRQSFDLTLWFAEQPGWNNRFHWTPNTQRGPRAPSPSPRSVVPTLE
jgi:hypothetical protein